MLFLLHHIVLCSCQRGITSVRAMRTTSSTSRRFTVSRYFMPFATFQIRSVNRDSFLALDCLPFDLWLCMYMMLQFIMRQRSFDTSTV
ncbi:hypothetical protein F5888DRAFT_1728041 [Russula emetica]|nr:hypothetical protein F5888DRAFT_1728041 [Russula emetica]